MSRDQVDRLVESWGQMGSLWGVNRSVARIHGLLIASERPHTLDEIAERLRISRSNVSTGLKELRSWGVVRKVPRPGERRELFACEPSIWKMLFSIMRERKRREFDPALAAVRSSLAEASRSSEALAIERLRELEDLLGTMDRIAERVLANEDRSRSLLGFLAGWS
jgi:DNA-binding transcriptional regulator GbsR (MarR family)